MERITKPIILLSPHSDDIALSIGGWLSFVQINNLTLLKDIEVFTGFIWSKALPHIPENKENAVKATSLRQAEEQSYCDYFGLKLTFGMLPDTSILNIDYRLPVNINDDQRLVLLKEMLVNHLDNKIVFAPISIGDHIDHRIFTKLALETLSESKLVVFYEDIPYATWFSQKERTCIIQEKLGFSAVPFICKLTTENKRSKEHGLAHYRSQLNNDEIINVMNYQPLGDDRFVEQVWVIAPSLNQVRMLHDLGFEKSP